MNFIHIITALFTNLYYAFFINPPIKRIIITILFDIQLITFSSNYFFYSVLFSMFFLQFFFLKLSKNFLSIKIANNICPQQTPFKFFSHKDFVRPFSSVTSSKIDFIFWYYYVMINFEFRIFLFIINQITSLSIFSFWNSLIESVIGCLAWPRSF